MFSHGQMILEASYLVHRGEKAFSKAVCWLDFKVFGLSESPGQVTSHLDGVKATYSPPLALGF